jgi:DNA mismatch repair protein MutS2
LLIGLAGASAGIDIARRMELAESILKEATAHLSPEHSRAGEYLKQLKSLVEDQAAVLGALEEERQVTAEKFTRLDLDFAKKEAERQARFERELNNAIREFNDETARLIGELADKAAASRLKKDAEARAAELRRSANVRIRKQAAAAPVTTAPPSSLQDEQPQALNTAAEITGDTSIDDGDIRERDRVRIRSLGKDGLVESISGDEYTVLAGSLRLRARRSDLQRLKHSSGAIEERAVSRPRSTAAGLAVTAAFSSEINLIGQTVDEATDRIDKYLDEAFLAGALSVRVVHGHGKGALKRAVAELLSGHPHVESFAPAPPKEGGSGATIVVLKK